MCPCGKALSAASGASSPFGRGGRAKQGQRGSFLASPAPHPCLSLWERCLSAAKTERVRAVEAPPALPVTSGTTSPKGRAKLPSQSPAVTALPKGEPSKGPQQSRNPLASPAPPSCLSLWERCLSAAKTERVHAARALRTLSAASGTTSPKGRAKQGTVLVSFDFV